MENNDLPVDTVEVPAVPAVAEPVPATLVAPEDSLEATESADSEAGDGHQPLEDHFIPEYVAPHATMEEAVMSELTAAAGQFIYAVGTTVGEVIRYMESAGDREAAVSGAALTEFQTAITAAATDTLYAHDDLQPTADREGSDWRQYVEHNGVKFKLSKPPLAVGKGSAEVISGSQATLLLEQLRGLGQTVTVPIPHTGIWITLKSAKLAALVQLDTKLANLKTALGRSSRGYAFSNDGVITHESLFEFILAHVIDCNIVNWTPEILGELIKAPDLGILAQAMAVTMYPKGFPYAQACVTGVDKCNHVTKAQLNLTKMFWTDNARLSPTQKSRIAARRERITPSVLEEYQKAWPEWKSSVVDLGNIRLLLQVPNMNQHIAAGHAWINDIEAMTEEAFGQSLLGRARDQYMTNQGQATRLCAFSHWVKEIQMDIGEEGELPKSVNDAETIRALLRDLSSDEEHRGKVVSGIMEYINDVTVGIVAVPNYPCGKCKKFQRTEEAPFTGLIPFDPINTFFSLQQFKLTEATQKGLI